MCSPQKTAIVQRGFRSGAYLGVLMISSTAFGSMLEGAAKGDSATDGAALPEDGRAEFTVYDPNAEVAQSESSASDEVPATSDDSSGETVSADQDASTYEDTYGQELSYDESSAEEGSSYEDSSTQTDETDAGATETQYCPLCHNHCSLSNPGCSRPRKAGLI